MLRAGRDLLSGIIEIDEISIGGEKAEKALVVIAEREDGKRSGQIQLQRIKDSSVAFVRSCVRVVPWRTIFCRCVPE
jgi:hypothetical protein